MKYGLALSVAFAIGVLPNCVLAQDESFKQAVNEELRARLPAEILSSNKLVSVNNGSFPPYDIVNGTELTGAAPDLANAVGDLLGVKIEHTTVTGLPALLTGINAGRYQFAFGPVGDFKSRQESVDFVDWVQEFVVFGVARNNPKGITSLDTACGHRVAVMASGSAESVIKKQAEKCVSDGKAAIEVQSFADQPSSILAVRSGRSDAFFSSQAPLTYFVQQANGQLELAGTGQSNGFEPLFQGAVVPKGSPLGEIMKDAMSILVENGTYAKVMTKWGLENNMLAQPGINLSGKASQ